MGRYKISIMGSEGVLNYDFAPLKPQGGSVDREFKGVPLIPPYFEGPWDHTRVNIASSSSRSDPLSAPI